MQLLKILLNELIIHEMEMIIGEKTSYQLIYQASSTQANSLEAFLEGLGTDFLTRIRNSENSEDVNVKQEIFEPHPQQVEF